MLLLSHARHHGKKHVMEAVLFIPQWEEGGGGGIKQPGFLLSRANILLHIILYSFNLFFMDSD